jgi:RNA methyltransferase, TrmH family
MRAMKLVASRANPLFKSLRKLAGSPRQRRKERMALLDGVHLVAAYRERVGLPRAVVVSAGAADSPEIARLLDLMGALEPVKLSDALFRELSSVATPSGILATIEIPEVLAAPREADCCVLVEDLQDPGNLGSILRSAAAAGVRDVLLSRACADAWSPRVLRAAMGAHFFLCVHEQSNLLAYMRDYAGQTVATAAKGGRPIFEVDLTRPTAFLFGNEGAGLAQTLLAEADVVAGVPMPGGTESLNVAAATAVCLFERVRQLRARSVRSPA